MATLPMYTVDAFTDEPFAGNPAGVCLIANKADVSEDLLQKIAAEMNISETSFITLLDNSSSFKNGDRFGLRWFTPTVEVPLCGHGTLSAAAILFNYIENKSEQIYFETLSGILTVFRSDSNLVSMSLPENKTVPLNPDCVGGIIQLIFSQTSSKPADVAFSPTTGKLVLRMPDSFKRQDLESLKFDIPSLISCAPGSEKGDAGSDVKVKGVIVTTSGGQSTNDKLQKYDFLSRYFAPWVGINEDPVTGSAHTVLAPYWSSILGKTTFYARQCSPRGGDLHVVLKTDPNSGEGRVEISGASTVVLKGEISVKRS